MVNVWWFKVDDLCFLTIYTVIHDLQPVGTELSGYLDLPMVDGLLEEVDSFWLMVYG